MNRLLVIDDDPEIARFIARAATTVGFKSQQTHDPQQFLAIVANWRPSVLVIDLVMPDVDGIQLLQELAHIRTQAEILLVSGMDGRTLESARRLGEGRGLRIAGIMSKPMRLEDLKAALQPLFRHGDAVTGETLRAAIDAGSLYLEYQPKLSLATLGLVGVEALARWQLLSGRAVPPDVFVPLAEREGLIDSLTDHVIRAAVRQAVSWQRQGFAVPVTVAVNTSALNLRLRDLPDRLAELCREAGLPTERLILEMTETATMQDPIQMAEVLTRLRLRGFGLSLDDFGTGYSSMLQLVRLPFTEIKIDRSFVGETVDLGRSLGLKVTAEGIETQAACDMLRSYGCDHGQGYLFSAAAPPDAIPKLAWTGVRSESGTVTPATAVRREADGGERS
ncbi:MAG: EAL domain-containing response regulator [Alphaproteobacteria bacterium]|nr:EAL domain-containing response regulator [Alphaproteobacteria bacterium]